jgi:hypothetical protein
VPFTQVYDSGASGLDPDEWKGYVVTSTPSSLPNDVLIKIEPLVSPASTWNLAGYACLTFTWRGVLHATSPCPVWLCPSYAGDAWSVVYRSFYDGGSFEIPGFRGCHWNINRWVGKCRVRVGFRT